jgi:hypothetical protein
MIDAEHSFGGRAAKGLLIRGGAYTCVYNNLTILGFTDYALEIGEDPQSVNISYQFFNNLTVQPGNGSNQGIYVVYPESTGATTTVFMNNLRLSGVGSGYALSLQGAEVSVANGWIEAINGHGIKFAKSSGGTYYPAMNATNVFVDSTNSNDTLIQWYDNNGVLPYSIRGYILIDGKVALDNGTLSDTMSGRVGYFYQPTMYNAYHTGSLTFGESSDINPSTTHKIYKSGTAFFIDGPGQINLRPDAGAATGTVSVNNSTGILATGRLQVATPVSPSTKTDACTKGEFGYDTSYIYICYSTNNWMRFLKDGTW